MTWRLRVNPIACTGHGLCAELLPEAITLDEWRYPILSSVPEELLPWPAARPPTARPWPCSSSTSEGRTAPGRRSAKAPVGRDLGP
jgi:hypothetical protein